MATLKTWAGRSSFNYTGSVKTGTKISFGSGHTIKISADQYNNLLANFRGKTVSIGTSRDCPPKGSVGDWLQTYITKTAIASYVGPILINEGYAEKDGSNIKFIDDLKISGPYPI